MGISTLQSYQGAQIFEILGLSKEVVEKYFTGAISRIDGMGFDEIAKEALAKHNLHFSENDIPVEQHYLLEENINGKEKVNYICSILTLFILLQYSTKKNDIIHLKSMRKNK